MRSALDNQTYAIFAQAPTPKGVEHFWYAVYHFNIKRIIMLCAFEDPRRGVDLLLLRYKPKSTGQKQTSKSNFTK